MTLVGTERLSVGTVVGGAVSYGTASTQDNAVLAMAIPARAANAVTNGSGTTLSATNIVAGIITRSGPTSPFIDTTDTAANIIAALPGGTSNPVPNSAAWPLYVQNISATQMTLAAGTNVTLAGDIIVPAKSTMVAQVQVTSATQVTIMGLGASYDGGIAGYLSSVALTQFGSSSGSFLAAGDINKQVSSSGTQPGATGADNVLAAYTLAANALDGVGNRLLTVEARGSFGSTGNNKRIKLIWNPSSATVGSTVGSGGTTFADTGTVTQNAGGWSISGSILKYGAANSNTQLCTSGPTQPVSSAIVAPALATATENATILIAVTGNASTAASDIVFNMLTIRASN